MMQQKLKLGVNVDHVATLRQARGTDYPDPVEAAKICAEAGAHGITVHLREDRRHIQDDDVKRMIAWGELPVNLEMAAAPEIMRIALELKPAEVCIVPEKRQELTTEGGLDVVAAQQALIPVIADMNDAGIKVSLFIEPDPKQIEAAMETGAGCVELHTGTYCDADSSRRQAELERLIHGAKFAHDLSLQVNAGHGIHVDNIGPLLRVPHLDTLNIGHSIVSRAVMVGMEAAVLELLEVMERYRGDPKS